jgi:hypothetical protein
MSENKESDAVSSSGDPSSDEMIFKILSSPPAGEAAAARIGRLALPNRKAIDTPNFVAITARGAVPHLTPDIVGKHTSLGGAHMALEDCALLYPGVVRETHISMHANLCQLLNEGNHQSSLPLLALKTLKLYTHSHPSHET